MCAENLCGCFLAAPSLPSLTHQGPGSISSLSDCKTYCGGKVGGPNTLLCLEGVTSLIGLYTMFVGVFAVDYEIRIGLVIIDINIMHIHVRCWNANTETLTRYRKYRLLDTITTGRAKRTFLQVYICILSVLYENLTFAVHNCQLWRHSAGWRDSVDANSKSVSWLQFLVQKAQNRPIDSSERHRSLSPTWWHRSRWNSSCKSKLFSTKFLFNRRIILRLQARNFKLDRSWDTCGVPSLIRAILVTHLYFVIKTAIQHSKL